MVVGGMFFFTLGMQFERVGPCACGLILLCEQALEKEKREAVQNSDKNNASVKELSQSCDQLRKDLVVVTKQKSSMEMLCRKLTEERTALKEKLKAYEPEPETKTEAAKEETAEADATNKQADASEPAAAAEEAAAEPVAAGQ